MSTPIELSRSIAPTSKIRDFVSTFYATSDDPTNDEEWVAYFLPDAVLVIGNDTVKGVDAIRELRQNMWEKVAERKHTPIKVFDGKFEPTVPGQVPDEYMLFGNLEYKMKTGEVQAVSWAAYAVLKETEGRLKFSYYRVYIQR